MQAAVRPASVSDIEAMHLVRLAVRENELSKEAAITEESYLPFVTKGEAWVAEVAGQVVGFAALDAAAMTVWALFVSPGAEKKGIGRALHDRMVECARQCGLGQLTLFTSPGTRAERFYTAAGWRRDGSSSTGEVRFRRQLRH
jgi:GNAT superfamily N-acetyltransferase